MERLFKEGDIVRIAKNRGANGGNYKIEGSGQRHYFQDLLSTQTYVICKHALSNSVYQSKGGDTVSIRPLLDNVDISSVRGWITESHLIKVRPTLPLQV